MTFQTVVEKLHGIEVDGITTQMLDILVGIFESGKIANKGQRRLIFPHGFGNAAEIERYWRKVESYDNGLLHILKLSYFEEGLMGGMLSRERDLNAFAGLEKELRAAGMEEPELALREDGYWVPTIGELPLEIIGRILEFVGGEGVIRFGIIEGGKRRGKDELSWFLRYLNVRVRVKMDESATGALKNYRRVWGICAGLLDIIGDAGRGKIEGTEDRGVTLLDFLVGHRLRVFLPKTGSGMERYFRLGSLKATGVMVSYVGSGNMRFVSGLRFLPGGERIGIINLEDEVHLDFWRGEAGKSDGARCEY
ncbi:hypothetical protein TWF281_002196 [Arthrobotrys megalospora]